MTDEELLALARQASQRAYAPHSGFSVGAAVMGESGAIYTGCNVENASYGATLCAERVAIAKMVSEGEQRLAKVAIYAEGEALAMPCGICRQVLAEFADQAVILVSNGNETERVGQDELFPRPFVFRRGS